MATTANGQVAIVAPPTGQGKTNHSLEDYPSDGSTRGLWRTGCGRDASNWIRRPDQNIATFIGSEHSCKRCVDFELK